MRRRLRNVVLCVLVAGAAFAQVSTEKEILLGEQLAAEIDSKQIMITDAEVTGFVDRVLKNLSRDESLRLPLKLRIVDNSELVASALPGGFLLLSSGAILRADTEAELAGLLSHAMGHVQTGQFTKPTKSTGSGVPVAFVGVLWRSCVRSGGAGEVLVPVGLFAQSDLREVQADMLGLGYMTNAGYDPQALVSVFEHWRGKFGPGEEVRARALALTSVSVTSVLNTSTFDEIKTRLAPRPASSRRLPTLYK